MGQTIILLILSHLFAALIGAKYNQWKLAKVLAKLVQETGILEELGLE